MIVLEPFVLMLPVLGLLLTVGLHYAPVAEAAESIRSKVIPSTAPWEGQVKGTELEATRLIAAADQALLILNNWDREWSPLDQVRLQALRDRLPDLIDQRPKFNPERLDRPEQQDEDLGVLAETFGGAEKPFCLYSSTLQQRFDRKDLLSDDAENTFLALVLVHEIFHLPRKFGGVVREGIPGDLFENGVVTVPCRHAALCLWEADLARGFVASPPDPIAFDSSQLEGCCAGIKSIDRLLDTGTVYGRAMCASIADSLDPSVPLGPLHWGLRDGVVFPESCGR